MYGRGLTGNLGFGAACLPAAPVYQMKQYYVYGTVDDCKGHWSKWFNCLKQKTKFKDEVRTSVLATPVVGGPGAILCCHRVGAARTC